MPSKRQVRTKTGSRKGKKLHGLTKLEAITRAKKGWETRHRQHGFGGRSARAPRSGGWDPYDAARRRAGSESELFEDPEYDKLSPEELVDRFGTQAQRSARRTEIREDQWGNTVQEDPDDAERAIRKARDEAGQVLAAEAEHLARFNEFKDPNTRELVRRLPPKQRAAFRALYMRNVEILKNRRAQDHLAGQELPSAKGQPNETRPADVRADAPYILGGGDDKQRQIRGVLLPEINHYPEQKAGRRPTGRYDPETETAYNEWKRESPEETRRRVQRDVERQFYVEDPLEQHLREQEGVPSDPRKMTRAQRRQYEAEKKISREPLDPGLEAHPLLSGGERAEARTNKEAMMKRRMNLVDPEDQKELVELIVQSHHGATEDERRSAHYKASDLLSRAAVKAQQNWDERTQLRDLLAADVKLGAELPISVRAARTPEPRMRDPRNTTRVETIVGGLRYQGDLDHAGTRNPFMRAKNRLEFEKKSLQEHYRFEKAQKERKLGGIFKGTANIGITEEGQIAPLTPKASNLKKLKGGIQQNAEWNYTLRDLENPEVTYNRAVDVFDRETTFAQGRRDTRGFLRSGEFDEIAAPPELRKKYNEQFRFEEGRRVLKTGEERTPEGVDEIVYVPMRGAKGHTHTDSDPSGATKRTYEVRDEPGGRWRPADRAAYNQAEPELRQQVTVPRKVQYKFHDPSELAPASGEVDTVRLQFGEVGPLKGDRSAFLNLPPGTRRHDVVSPYLRERRQVRFERQAQTAVDIERNSRLAENYLRGIGADEPTVQDAKSAYKMQQASKHGIIGKDELRKLGAAGIAAGYYAGRKSSEERTKSAFNRAFDRLGETGPVGRFVEKHDIRWTDEALAVDRAYVRPFQEKRANIKHMFKNPLSSPEGRTPGGIEVGRLRYRDWGISQDKFVDRRIERWQRESVRAVRTRNYVRTMPDTRYHRWRKGPMQRHEEYRQFSGPESFMAKRIRAARDIHQAPTDSMVAIHDPFSGEHIEVKATAHAQQKARHFADFAHNLEHTDFHAERAFRNRPPRPPSAGFVKTAFEDFNPKHPAVIAGAVIGAAIGAHYLHHKYVESKKDEADRIAYYNKVLPKHVKVPFVNVRPGASVRTPTNAFTSEFGLANRKVPVGVTYSYGIKDVPIRPSERFENLHPNAKIIGRPSFRGTKGGSWKNSLIFHGDDPRNRRQWTRGNREIYIAGKKLPGKFEVSARHETKLTATNPQRMTNKDREDIVWATKGTPQETILKQFYSFGKRDPIVDMYDDPEALERISKHKGDDLRKRRRTESYQAETIVGAADETEPWRHPESDRSTSEDVFRGYMSQYPHTPLGAPRTPSRREQFATGGTMGIDPYSQIGQKRTKHDEHFNEETGQWEMRERPIGSTRRTPERGEFLGTAADVNAPEQREQQQTHKRKRGRPKRQKGN